MKKIRAIIHEFTSLEANLFIYSLSFSLLLSLAPSLVVFAMLFNFAMLDIKMVGDFLTQLHIPAEQIDSVFVVFMSKEYALIPTIITLATSFWLASRSVYSFLLISASHEDVDVPKWAIRIQSIIMFVLFAGILIIAIVISTLLSHILSIIASLLLVVIFYIMYRSLSFRKRNASFGLIGALFTTSAIMVISYLSFLLIRRFTSYDNIYGPLASLVALLLVIYIISGVVYFGFLLNLVFEDSYEKEAILPMKHQSYYRLCVTIYEKLPFIKKKDKQ